MEFNVNSQYEQHCNKENLTGYLAVVISQNLKTVHLFFNLCLKKKKVWLLGNTIQPAQKNMADNKQNPGLFE